MGLLVQGHWVDRWYDTGETGGRFVRGPRTFRGQIGASGRFPAQPGRYHLYVSLACPWAHRTLVYRALLGLQDVISVSVVDPRMGEEGWVFGDYPGATTDDVNGATRLHEIYTRAQPDYTGRVTVPVLWDKETRTIVNNESSEIIRMLDAAFRPWARPGDPSLPPSFYPEPLRAQIDAINARVYDRVNDGVYKAGFATRQEVYEEAVKALFDALDELEERLAGQRYLVGGQLTEADWRLFTTLVRFDAVYHGHFKCNRRRLIDYPQLSSYARDLYQVAGVAGTVDLDHIQRHYYWSHTSINPTRIVPVGPEQDFDAPHDRARLA